jgi:hypothetical protein
MVTSPQLMFSRPHHLTKPSVNRRFAQITSPLVLSSISIGVKPSRLSIGLFWLSRNPSIMDWCTTLHFTLQNTFHFAGAANSTALQDHLQSQIIGLLPRLTTLRIRVKLLAYPDAMYDQTVAALASLEHVKDISFTVDSECSTSTYSTQILHIFAPSIRTLCIDSGDTDWLTSNGSFSGFLDGNCNIFRPWSFPNLQSLDLRNFRREEEIYAQIPFDTPLVTLVLSFNTLLASPTTLSLPPRRVQRLVLWVSTAWMPPRPRLRHGLSSNILDLRIPIESTRDLPLTMTFMRLGAFVVSLSGETVQRVTWKIECSTPELCAKVKGELQQHSIVVLFELLAAACHDRRLQWELEGP